jgi:hypothetical protein
MFYMSLPTHPVLRIRIRMDPHSISGMWIRIQQLMKQVPKAEICYDRQSFI